MHTVRPGCPDYVWCQLDVTAPAVEMIRPFVSAAAGPGFIDWQPNWYELYERTYWRLRASRRPDTGEGPAPAAANDLAWSWRDRCQTLYETERNRASADPTRVPLDLASLVPIPGTVLEAGVHPAGERWMMRNWGTPAPLRRVSFKMELRPIGDGFVRQVAAFRFLAEDWAPWIALEKIRRIWPALTFDMTCRYD